MPTDLALSNPAEFVRHRGTPAVTVDTNTTGISTVETRILLNASVWKAWSSLQQFQTMTSASNETSWLGWNRHYATTQSSSTLYSCTEETTSVTMASQARHWAAWNYQYSAAQPGRFVAEAARSAAVIQSNEEWRKKNEEDERQREESEAKAEKLLRSCLSREQVDDLVKKDHFFLTTHDSKGEKHRYRINRGMRGNVKRVDEKGNILESLCFHPDGVPVADAMLAQKLMLDADVDFARKTANISTPSGAILQRASQAHAGF